MSRTLFVKHVLSLYDIFIVVMLSVLIRFEHLLSSVVSVLASFNAICLFSCSRMCFWDNIYLKSLVIFSVILFLLILKSLKLICVIVVFNVILLLIILNHLPNALVVVVVLLL